MFKRTKSHKQLFISSIWAFQFVQLCEFVVFFFYALNVCHWVLLFVSFIFNLLKLLCYRHHLNKFTRKCQRDSILSVSIDVSYLLRSCFQSNCLICCLIYFRMGLPNTRINDISPEASEFYRTEKQMKWAKISIDRNEINVNWIFHRFIIDIVIIRLLRHINRTRAISVGTREEKEEEEKKNALVYDIHWFSRANE